MRLWAWQFSTAETQGVGRRIAELEAGQVVQKAENDSHVQHFVSIELPLCAGAKRSSGREE